MSTPIPALLFLVEFGPGIALGGQAGGSVCSCIAEHAAIRPSPVPLEGRTSRESPESTSLVFLDVLPERRAWPVAVGDIERCCAQGRVLGYASLRRRGLSEDHGGVLGDLDQFGGYHGVEPDEIPEHLFEFFVLLHECEIGGASTSTVVIRHLPGGLCHSGAVLNRSKTHETQREAARVKQTSPQKGDPIRNAYPGGSRNLSQSGVKRVGYIDDIKRVGRDANPFFTLMGIVVDEFGDGQARLSMDVRPDMLNGAGWLQGGVYVALADEAIALALYTRLADNEEIATIDEHTSFIKGVNTGTVTATGRVIRKGRRVAFADGEVRSAADGTLLSRTSASFAVIAR